MRFERAPFWITTQTEELDLARIHRFLTESYWAKGIPLATVKKSIQNSLCFGVFHGAANGSTQVGFCRVVSDFATFAYFGDVYIEPEWRGQGLSKWLIECVMGHPELQGLRRFCLATRDAHELYSRFGFEVIKTPENWMEIKVSNPYS